MKFLAVDTETTGNSFFAGCKPFAVSMCNEAGGTQYFEGRVKPYDRTQVLWAASAKKQILEILLEQETLVFHNATFDLKALLHLGWTTAQREKLDSHFRNLGSRCQIHDTMVMAHILDSKGPKALKDLGILHLKIPNDDEITLERFCKSIRSKVKDEWDIAVEGHPTLPGQKSEFHKCDMWLPKTYVRLEGGSLDRKTRKEMEVACENYATLDAVRTCGLFHMFNNSLREDRQTLGAYKIQQRCIIPLVDMETSGLHLVEGEFEKTLVECQTIASDLKTKMVVASQDPSFNPDSAPQLRKVLFEKFKFDPVKHGKTGPSADKESLALLSLQKKPFRHKKFVTNLLNYRAVNAALKYLKSYQRFQVDHMVYPNMNLVGTSTTRLSSAQPNGQNVSKGKETDEFDENGNPKVVFSLRRVFGPPQGHKWYAVDYDQLQIRIFAFLSQEQSLIDAIRRGFDFHTKVASDLFGTDEPTKAQRKVAKYVNFGIIFGAGEARIAHLSGDPGAYRRFTKLYPNVADYIAATSAEVRENGFIRTASGYPLTVPRNKAYAGVNYRVQGTEGDIVKQSLIQLHSHFERNNDPIKIILQVHDEFIFQCPLDYEFPTSTVQKIMEVSGEMYGVECKTKPELILNNWAEGEEIEQQEFCTAT